MRIVHIAFHRGAFSSMAVPLVLQGGRMDAAGVGVFAAQLSVGVVLMGAVGYAARREFNRHAHATDVEMQRLESEDDQSV